jgi:hypothetical protein
MEGEKTILSLKVEVLGGSQPQQLLPNPSTAILFRA